MVTVLLACCALLGAGLAGAAPGVTAEPAGAPPLPKAGRWTPVAPGVRYTAFDSPAAKGPVRAHVLAVDLARRGVVVDLLHPGVVAARAPLSRLADARGAVGGVNGDFFNLSEAQHPGVEATGAPVGPAIAGGRVLKAAVPEGQRFGPRLPPGTSTRDVLGVGFDGRARLDRLTLDGSVSLPAGQLELGGLNQYALPVGSVGLFTPAWGAASRVRATCGTDTDRGAPCSEDTHEVTVRQGRVVAVAGSPGGGQIAEGDQVLVGREAGARALRALSVGDRVAVRHRLLADRARAPFRFAVGGFPVVRGGQPLAGLDTVTAAVRTAAGIRDQGRTLLLLALDGSPAYRGGLSVAEAADLMRSLGSVDAFCLDGGGSSTLVAREPDRL